MTTSSSSSPSSNSAQIPFWLMGILNNVSYIIMLAGAKEISEGETALVYLANILPTLLVKVTSPFWFHKVSYSARILTSAVLFFLSFVIVAFFSTVQVDSNTKMDLELIGISFGSFGSGMGEATLLAFAGKVCGEGCISAYSSGTGTAGVLGFLYFVALRDWIGFSFGQAMWIGTSLCIAYGKIFLSYLKQYESYDEVSSSFVNTDILEDDCAGNEDTNYNIPDEDEPVQAYFVNQQLQIEHRESVFCEERTLSSLTGFEKFQLVLSLWQYMVPLYFVYSAEYAMQSGAWTAIGFPVEDEIARDKFYEYAGWSYQFGVLLSRSSGFLLSASVEVLWVSASLQVVILVFFVYDAVWHVWYDWGLLVPCFVVGLFGGFVYVQSFKRITHDVPRNYKEFALSSCSMADTFGIVIADSAALVIQSCLYERNGIKGATIDCPL